MTLLPLATIATSLASSASNPAWYVTRAAAISSYLFLTLTAALGVVRSLARVRRAQPSRALWLLDEAHRFAALLTALFLGLHLGALLFDSFTPFSLLNLALPFDEPYRPLATGVGIFAFYGLAALLLTSWLRRRFTYALWRGVHYLSFVAFALVTIHGALAGSDSGQLWMTPVYWGALALVSLLGAARIILSPGPSTRRAPASQG